MASEGVGIGSLLHLALADGDSHQAQPALDDLLLDVASFGTGEGLDLADKGQAGLGDLHSLHTAGFLVRRQQQGYFVVERYGEGIYLHRGAIGIHVHFGWPQIYLLDLGQATGFGYRYRQGCYPVHLGGCEQMTAGKAPRPICDHSHAKPLRAMQGQLLHDAILDCDVLDLAAHDPDIGIRRALYLSQV